MPQGSSSRKRAGNGSSRVARAPAAPVSEPSPRADNGGGESPAVVLDCIIANTRELKKLAIRSGFSQIALILEMAELEASDQVGRINKRTL